MINALVYHGDELATIELPTDRLDLRYEMLRIGIFEHPAKIPINDDKDRAIQVKLSSDSDFGNCMAKLFTPSYSLDDANLCAYMVENARMEILEEIEQNLLHEQYTTPQELMDSVRTMTDALASVEVNYYCPLKIQMSDKEYGDFYEADNEYAVMNEDAVRERLQKEQDADLDDIVDYFNGSESAREKLVSAKWDVENVNGELFGVIRTKLTEAFTPDEEQEWIDELIGQAADGFGEGFEQREIKTDDGEMYVSFWNDSEDYFMENESDFRLRLSNQQQMGGM